MKRESGPGSRRRTSTVFVIFQASRTMPKPWDARIIHDVFSELSTRYRKMTACMKTLARIVRTLVPTLSKYWLKKHEEDHKDAHREGFFKRWQSKFERGFEHFRGGYHALLERALHGGYKFAGLFLGAMVATHMNLRLIEPPVTFPGFDVEIQGVYREVDASDRIRLHTYVVSE